MGIFDRFSAKNPAPDPGAPAPASPAPAAPPPPGDIRHRLNAAREKLGAKDLAGATAIYKEVLAAIGDRPDVLLTISGDLGSHGYIPIIELIAPRYDAERHGPAIGFNLLQAYLAVRDTEAAQHVLDMLFSLNRPDLEDRLFGFSNAIVEITAQASLGGPVAYEPGMAHEVGGEAPSDGGTGVAPGVSRVSMVSISKPIWFYGLEALADSILPPKREGLRRVAFAQLARLGPADPGQPEDELSHLTRSLPLWLAETFYFSPQYSPHRGHGLRRKIRGRPPPDGLHRGMGDRQPPPAGRHDQGRPGLRLHRGAEAAGGRLRDDPARLGDEKVPRAQAIHRALVSGDEACRPSSCACTERDPASSWSGRLIRRERG